MRHYFIPFQGALFVSENVNKPGKCNTIIFSFSRDWYSSIAKYAFLFAFQSVLWIFFGMLING